MRTAGRRRGALRAAVLTVAVALGLGLSAGSATATDGPPALVQQLAAVDHQLQVDQQRENTLAAQQKALDSRTARYNQRSKQVLAELQANNQAIDAHNQVVAGYPDGAPPAVADSLNAEAAQLNAKHTQLQAQARQIASEGDQIKTQQQQQTQQQDTLDSEVNDLLTRRQALLQQLTTALLIVPDFAPQAPPPAVDQAPGGDQAQPAANDDGQAQAAQADQAAGGDTDSSGLDTDAALDDYARQHHVKVDRRPVVATLTPQAVSLLSAKESRTLAVRRTFDGLVRKSNGNYLALSVGPDRPPFDVALTRGGLADAVVDGRHVVIDEVEVVPGRPGVPTTRDLRTRAAELVRRYALGWDAAKHKFVKSEMETALRIEAVRNVTLTRSTGTSEDWFDQYHRGYDAVGNFSSRFFDQQWPTLQGQIRRHVAKAQFVPVDVTGLTPTQIATVKQFVEANQKDFGRRVFIVGG